MSAAISTVVVLNWDAIADTDDYHVERATVGPAGPFTDIGTLPGSDPGLTFFATGLSPSKPYYFRMRPFLNSGKFGEYTEVRQVFTAPLKPTIQGSLGSSSSVPSVDLEWSSTTEFDGSRLEYRPGATGPFLLLAEPGSPKFTHSDMVPGTNQYRVWVSLDGSLSEDSNIVSFDLNTTMEQDWRFANFGTVNNTGDAADDADPDDDGFTNAEERAGCSDPNDDASIPLPPPGGSITYVDATDGPGGNTALADGSVFTATAVNSDDDQWQAVSAGIGGTMFQTNNTLGFSAGEDGPGLRCTIGGLQAGRSYEVFAYFWSHGNISNYQLRASLGSMPPLADEPGTAFSRMGGEPGFGSPNSTDAPAVPTGVDDGDNLGVCYTGSGELADSDADWTGSDQYFTMPLLLGEGGDALYQADLGVIAADGSGDIHVYLDDASGAALNTRTTFDGVGYRLVPAPLRVTAIDFDPGTGTVTLRWPDNLAAYEVASSANLVIGELVDSVIPVEAGNGTIDTVSFPGEIEFRFVDPIATGPVHFWQVREQE